MVDINSLLRNKGGGNDFGDEDWISSAFMVSQESMTNSWNAKRFHSSADRKYMDTSLGGSLCCNPKTQYTRYADVRRQGRLKGDSRVSEVSIHTSNHATGMGQFYSEHIDDHTQLLFLQFGVAQFGSLYNFFARAVDKPTSVMAKHASGDTWYWVGKAAGTTLAVGIGVRVSKTFAVLALSLFVGKAAYGAYFGDTHHKYYWLKDSMHVYWNTVNNLVTSMSVEIGIISPTIANRTITGVVGTPLNFTHSEINTVNKIFGSETGAEKLFTSQGFLDVRRVVNRTAKIFDNENLAAAKHSGVYSEAAWSKTMYGTPATSSPMTTTIDFVNSVLGLGEYRGKAGRGEAESEDPEIADKDLANATNIDGDGLTPVLEEKEAKKRKSSVRGYLDSAINGGARFAIFQVEYMGEQTTSFSSTYKDIPVQGAMNSMGGATRDIAFSTAGGNIISDVTQTMITAVKDMAEGVLAGVTFGASNILTALLGGGFVEMPKMWEDSDMSAQQYTFKTRLSQPYNHPLAKLQKQYIPMAMILAGALPLATGKATYVSPHLCKAFMRGVLKIDLGMITEVTLSHAVGSQGKDYKGSSLAIDMEWTITDFSTLLSAPISSFAFGSIVNPIDETSPMGRFMSSLGGRTLDNSKFTSRKFGLRFMAFKSSHDQAVSPDFLSTLIGDVLSPVQGLFVHSAAYNSDPRQL